MRRLLRLQSLESRLVLAIVLVACPLIVMAVLWLGTLSARLAEASANEQLSTKANSAANSVERWDQYFVMALQNLRGQPDIVSMNPDDQRPVLNQMKKTYDRLEIVRVTATSGISEVRTDGTAPVNYSDREWFKACMSGQSVARQALITKTGNKAALNISTPILAGDGKIIGVLSAVTSLASMADVLGIPAGNEAAQMFVVDEKGRLLAAPNLESADSLKDMSDSPPVQYTLKGQDGAATFKDSTGEAWIAQTVRLANGWSVICQMPRRVVFAQSTQIMHTAYAVGAVALILLAGFSGLIARQMTRPIRELTQAADDLARGQWSRRVVEGRGDELGQLATSFNQMVDQLEAAHRLAAVKAAELEQSNEALQSSEERYALAVRGANDGLWDWDIHGGRIHYSSRWKEMLGCENAQVTDSQHEWFSRVHSDDLESLQAAISAHRDQLTPHFQIEHRMRHADGGYRWMLSRGLAIRDSQGKATRMAGSQTDVTARREAEEQLLRDALHDSLTTLPNRVLLSDRLEHSIARMMRDNQHRFAVLFIDMDRFKGINDSLGHGVGDQLLIAFARRIGACLRPTDTFARLGGDEFTILLEDPQEPDDASSVAARILDALKTPFNLDSHEIYITASIGIALSNIRYSRPQDVLRDADTAMYRAKAKGKARYEVFDVAMHTRAVNLLQMENDLRRAIDRNEFELFYQPIIRMEGGDVKAFEALIRWRHPEKGLIAPDNFIPIAEETGLILTIGRWVLMQACRQAVEWHALTPGKWIDMNVNLSGKQFSQTCLVEQVMEVLQKTGMPAKNLILEITESVVMENPEATIATLHRLKALGVQLNIDDFGTGYSSLAYLQRFPVDTMKIDRSFVARMIQSPENAEIIKTIVHLAHSLNMKVTAEGIETSEQLAQLDMLQCENAQGYLFSHPLDSKAATDLLSKWVPQKMLQSVSSSQ